MTTTDESTTPAELPAGALPAWQAYTAMIGSKERHFAYLQALEEKYSRYGAPSPAEQAERQQLLAEHDRCVSAFRTALQTLKIDDPVAYGRLVLQLAQD